MATAKKPWKRKNPATTHTKLTAASKRAAKARAKKAGRAYPNLVDNMHAAKLQKQRARKSPSKKQRAT